MEPAKLRIRDLAQIRAGYQSRKGVKSTPTGSHALLQIRDFNEERTRIDLGGITRISPGPINDEQILRDGDVLFLAKGAKNFSFVPKDLPKPALAASYFFILRPGRAIDPAYLAWFLNLDSTRQTLSRYVGHGTHMPVVRREVLENLQVSLPDIDTQRMIVDVTALADKQLRLLADLAHKKQLLATAACVLGANQSTSDQDNS